MSTHGANGRALLLSIVELEHVWHLPRGMQQEMINEIRRVLRPDGCLILSSPNRKVYSEKAGHHNQFHVRELDFDELAVLLGQYFGAIAFGRSVVDRKSVV